MKEIKWLAEQIEEELEDAEHYAMKAAHFKDSDMDMSRVCAELSRQELKHSEMLHEQAVRLIKAHRAAKGDPPPAMLAVWDYQHEKMLKRTAKVKAMLSEA